MIYHALLNTHAQLWYRKFIMRTSWETYSHNNLDFCKRHECYIENILHWGVQGHERHLASLEVKNPSVTSVWNKGVIIMCSLQTDQRVASELETHDLLIGGLNYLVFNICSYVKVFNHISNGAHVSFRMNSSSLGTEPEVRISPAWVDLPLINVNWSSENIATYDGDEGNLTRSQP